MREHVAQSYALPLLAEPTAYLPTFPLLLHRRNPDHLELLMKDHKALLWNSEYDPPQTHISLHPGAKENTGFLSNDITARTRAAWKNKIGENPDVASFCALPAWYALFRPSRWERHRVRYGPGYPECYQRAFHPLPLWDQVAVLVFVAS
ncbi:hypothetical protein D3C75_601150 [compost metagenome]